MEIFCDWNKAHLHKEEEVFAMVYFGKNKACKTEADAREAAELLKQFFEAKEAGKVARLMVNTGALHGWQDATLSYPKPEGPNVPKNKIEVYCSDNGHSCLIVGQCANGCKHAPQRPKNTVIDQMNDEPPNVYERIRDRVHMKAERHARQQIAHMAAIMYTNGNYLHTVNAVQEAAEIWRLSQQVEL